MEHQKQDEIRELIRSNKVNKNLNTLHQNRHVPDSGAYIKGRSYLFNEIDPITLIEQYHGTGNIKFSESGNWVNKEFITLDTDIGIHIEQKTGRQTATNSFGIHYSKKGAHIVPSRRQE